MNTQRVVLGIPYLCSLVVCSHSLFAADFTVVLDAGPHQRTVQSVSASRDEEGNPVSVTNTFVELRSGLNRWSEPEQAWVPASDFVEEINGRLIARQTQHRILFGSTADDGEGVVDLLMINGARFRVRPLGVAYTEVRDGTSGRSLFIAEVNAATPTLTAPNQVTYEDALPGADLQYDVSLAGIEQNIVFRNPLPLPSELNLDERLVRVEVWTEVLESPAPTRESGRLVRADGSADTDEGLGFGPMRMADGRAFGLDEEAARSIPVAKLWHQIDGRTFLIESVPYVELAAMTSRLDGEHVIEFDQEKLEVGWARQSSQPSPQRGLPVHGVATRARSIAAAGSEKERTPDVVLLAQNRAAPLRCLPGVVLDWSLLSTASNFTFKGDTTYYVSGPLTLSVTGNNKTVIEGGTVVKFTNSATAQITITGALDCQTDSYRPAVFTSKDDDSVGEKITGSTGTPSGYYGSGIYVQSSTLRNLRMSFAYTGISLATAQTLTLQDSQFVSCLNAFLFYAQTTSIIENSLFHHIDGFATGGQQSTTVNGANLTVHDCATMAALGANSAISLVNSLLVALDSEGTPPMTPDTSNATEPEGAGTFMTVGAGAHYLKPNSPHRDAGSTDIDGNLLGRLRRKTTCPPVPLVADFIANTVLDSRNLEDVGPVDRGFHYDVLDYLASSLNVTNNSTLTLTNGTAVGSYGPRLFWLRGTSKMVSEGLPNRLNRLTTFHTVQEQPVKLIANTASMTLINGSAVTMRFSDVSFLAAATGGRNLIPDNPFGGTVSLHNSHLRGVYWHFYNYSTSGFLTPTIRMTNSILERCKFDWTQGYAITPFNPYYLYVTLRNCLFSRSTVVLGHYGYYYGGWDLYDNLFDGCSVTLTEYDPYNQSGAGGPLTTVGYNGYLATTGSLGGSGNKTITTRDFLSGLLGGYYYPTSGGNLSLLINAGSRTASAAGLSTYTTAVNNAVDSGTVDIGFHYFATDPNVVVTIERTTLAANAQEPDAGGAGGINGRFTVTRTGSTASSLNAYYLVSGAAINGVDYGTLSGTGTIQPGQQSADINFSPVYDALLELPESVTLTVLMTNTYSVGPAAKATESIADVQSVVFQVVADNLDRPVGIDYNADASVNSLIVSLHWPDGIPNNFIRINSSGAVSSWSTVSGMPNEIKLAAVRASGGSFTLGDQYFGTGVDRKIGKLLANGTSPNLNWVTLPVESETRVHSLHVDTTSVFGGDLIAVTGDGTDGGGVWRVTSSGGSTLLTDLNIHLEGVLTVPNATAKYGPWAGKILAGSEDESRIYAIDVNGVALPFQVAVSPGSGNFIEPEDIDLIPADQDLYVVDAGNDGQSDGRVWKVPRATFAAFAGDLLVTQEGPESGGAPRLFIVRWDGCDFVAREFTDPGVVQFEHVTFAPVNIPAE